MPLREEFEKTGNWLFRWRSYFPLLILPLLLLALQESEYLERISREKTQMVWEVFCIGVSYLGLLVRILTVGFVPEGTSGRNTKGQLAEELNTEGMYSMVRHPLYLGNFLIFLGMVLFVQVWWFVIISVLFYGLYYERIMFAEEEFLRRKFGEQYESWGNQTPAFIPRLRNWKRSKRSFSMRMILKREYSGFFGIIVAFVALKFFGNLLAEGEVKFQLSWKLFLVGGFLVYGVLHFLRKRTQVLHIKK